MSHQTDNLVRALLAPSAATYIERASDTENHTERALIGEFAVFDQWTEIDSWWEGNFMESLKRGAFARSIDEHFNGGRQVKILFNHGRDPSIGNKPLGPIREMYEAETGAHFDVPLIETDYNRDFIIPAARANLLGASFRFSVRAEQWVEKPDPSDYNPRGLPERVITDLDLFEAGPVTFPAYAQTSVGLRSGTDEFFDALIKDPTFVARIAERTNGRAAAHMVAQATANGHAEATPPPAADNVPKVRSLTQRRALVRRRSF